MGPWVSHQYWHWSYARNPLFALPSLLQVGRAFKDPDHGSVGQLDPCSVLAAPKNGAEDHLLRLILGL